MPRSNLQLIMTWARFIQRFRAFACWRSILTVGMRHLPGHCREKSPNFDLGLVSQLTRVGVRGITRAMRGAVALPANCKKARPQCDTDLLDSTAHQLSQFFLILGRHFIAQGWASHALVWVRTHNLQAIRDLATKSTSFRVSSISRARQRKTKPTGMKCASDRSEKVTTAGGAIAR